LYYILHASLGFDQAQDLDNKKAELMTPHFFRLNQDIVSWSKGEKWGLKYVIQTPGRNEKSGAEAPPLGFGKLIAS